MIAVNGYDETKEVIGKFVTEKKLKQPVLRSADLDGDGSEEALGSAVAYDLFGVAEYPSSFWIDAKGIVLDRDVGFDPSHVPAMERRIEKLLQAAKSP